jgi:hypothetical protein
MFFTALRAKAVVKSNHLAFPLVQAVAYTGFCEQISGTGRIGFQLVAKLPHVNSQVVAMFDMGSPPNLFEQLPVSDDESGVAYQYVE